MPIPQWWQDAILYQIYPRSFADGNDDGIGDIPGIIEKLNYLQWLGVTALWISPFYPSPLFDVGYDIADYTGIAPEYGTLSDFDDLLAKAHERGIRVLLDLVLNHTSDQHPWFQESRSSRDNPKRDWFIWHEGKNGGPPNNWESIFGGPAWTLDERTGQYYYHFFFTQQPDLNWRNPEVREAMFNAMRFWLDRGVDGFRLDALGTIFEDENLTDSPAEVKPNVDLMVEYYTGQRSKQDQQAMRLKFQYQRELAETFQLMGDLRRLCDEYEDRVLLGETKEVSYYGSSDDPYLHSVFNFDLTNIGALDAEAIRRMLRSRIPAVPLGAWESNTIGNHDRSRAMTIFADGQYDQERMQVALAMVAFLWGTPTFYNGEEIGMRDLFLPDISLFRDNRGTRAYEAVLRAGKDAGEALRVANVASRDRCRTPMQWENAPNAGFSSDDVQTWLPVNPDYAEGINAVEQSHDHGSLLHFFRRVAQTRHANIALRRGSFDLVDNTGPVLAFWRRHKEQTCLVALNMSAKQSALEVRGTDGCTVIFSSHSRGPQTGIGRLLLAPYEVLILGK